MPLVLSFIAGSFEMTSDAVFEWIAEQVLNGRAYAGPEVKPTYTDPDRIIEIIEASSEPIPPITLRAMLGVGKSTMQRMIRNALETGRVEPVGKGGHIRYRRTRK